MQTGALIPSRIDSDIKRQVPYRERASYLTNFVKSNPRGFFRVLPPKTNEYARLMKEKIRLERLLASGGWGPKVPVTTLKPGQSGNAVVALRNRLVAMGFMRRSASQRYDQALQAAVQQFQSAHGLATDGVAGPSTMAAINTPVQTRLQSILVPWVDGELTKRRRNCAAQKLVRGSGQTEISRWTDKKVWSQRGRVPAEGRRIPPVDDLNWEESLKCALADNSLRCPG
jgi:hypothetical protein